MPRIFTFVASNKNPMAQYFLDQSIDFQILLSLLMMACLIQLGYFWIFFSRISFFRKKNTTSDQPPVSIVLVANNQYEFLQTNLPALLEQEYPDFEVVVVNDNSDDGTEDLLKELSHQHNNLQSIVLKQSLNWFKGRKFPLSLGIKSAKNDFILFTDPACKPISDQWISEIISSYDGQTEIVLGYASWQTTSVFNRFYRFVAFYDALFYFSMALSGIPFKGIGKNLSYKRGLFYKHKGFSSHYTISAGEDEIFVNKAAKKQNTSICIHEAGKVISEKNTSFLNWLNLERSRLKIRRFFKPAHRVMISLYSASVFIFYTSFAFLLIAGFHWLVPVSVFALRLISQTIIFAFTQKKLSEKKLLLLSPFFEIFILLIDFFIWINLLFSRKYKWT